MHQSLLEHCKNFHLYVFAFDDESYRILNGADLQHATIIPLADFENEDLLRVKKDRTKGEYCWTCTPSTILYCINTYNLPHCTYLDADLFFFDDPRQLTDEMNDSSVLITEHRYTEKYDQSAVSGIYCVQFVTFKNTADGMEVLNWWKDRCIEWCYGRVEDGKFGDQKYLDDWTSRFNGVHVLDHEGGGLAPWNIQQYTIEGNRWAVTNKKTGKKFPVVFYHFHHLTFTQANKVDLGSLYDLKAPGVVAMYTLYLKKIIDMNRKLVGQFGFLPRLRAPATGSARIREVIVKLYRLIAGKYHVLDLERLTE
jgi:hypothetical protein